MKKSAKKLILFFPFCLQGRFLRVFLRKGDNPFPIDWVAQDRQFCLFNDNRLKKQVAREFGLPQYTYLESWIRCITVLRNCCAHHARIWNRRFALKPQLPNRLTLHWITSSQKPIKLYHQLCTLLYLEQTITPCMDLKKSLFKLFAEYPNVDLHAMGFPQGWENEPLWRL